MKKFLISKSVKIFVLFTLGPLLILIIWSMIYSFTPSGKAGAKRAKIIDQQQQETTRQKIQQEQDTLTAFYKSQEFVKKYLKSPRTAKFPWLPSDSQIKNTKNNIYQVSSYVDSQNSFGAIIRTNYIVIMEKVSGNEWKLINIDFQ